MRVPYLQLCLLLTPIRMHRCSALKLHRNTRVLLRQEVEGRHELEVAHEKRSEQLATLGRGRGSGHEDNLMIDKFCSGTCSKVRERCVARVCER